MENELLQKKANELAEYLSISANEIEMLESSEHHQELFKTPDGVYTVMTEYEANEAFIDNVKRLIKDFQGVSFFPADFKDKIYRECVDQDAIRKVIADDKHAYVDELSTDEVVNYLTKYKRYAELIPDGVNINDLDEDQLDKLANDLRDDLAEAMVDDMADEYDGFLSEYYVDCYGDEELESLYQGRPDIIDVDKIAELYKEEYDYGHQLAACDCETIKTNGFYAFKQDDGDKRSPEFLKTQEKSTKPQNGFEH